MLRNFEAVDIGRETNADVLLLVTMKVWDAPDSAKIGAIGPEGRGFAPVTLLAGGEWVRYGVPLKCLAHQGRQCPRAHRTLRAHHQRPGRLRDRRGAAGDRRAGDPALPLIRSSDWGPMSRGEQLARAVWVAVTLP